MSVALQITIEERCNVLWLRDITGKYDPQCNPGGWCMPNEDISQATNSEWHIYPPGSDSPIIINCFPSFPTQNKEALEVLPEDLGMEEFPSGVWRFDYYVWIDGAMIQPVSCQKLLTYSVSCCLSKKKMEVDVDNFESKEVVEYNRLCLLLESAKCNAKLGKTKEAQKIIDFLKKKCKCKC